MCDILMGRNNILALALEKEINCMMKDSPDSLATVLESVLSLPVGRFLSNNVQEDSQLLVHAD